MFREIKRRKKKKFGFELCIRDHKTNDVEFEIRYDRYRKKREKRMKSIYT